MITCTMIYIKTYTCEYVYSLYYLGWLLSHIGVAFVGVAFVGVAFVGGGGGGLLSVPLRGHILWRNLPWPQTYDRYSALHTQII